MVAGDCQALVLQHLTHRLHIFPGGAIDNAAFFPPLLHKSQKPGVLIPGPDHPKVQVGPVKTGGHHLRIPETQHLNDVLLHLCRGSRGEGSHHRSHRQLLQKLRNLQIAGPEILAPLGHAVGLIHCHQRHRHPAKGGQERRRRQPLRRHV